MPCLIKTDQKFTRKLNVVKKRIFIILLYFINLSFKFAMNLFDMSNNLLL